MPRENGLIFDVGHRVKVIDRIYGHDFEIGEVVAIVEIGEGRYYRCRNNNHEEWNLTDEEVIAYGG